MTQNDDRATQISMMRAVIAVAMLVCVGAASAAERVHRVCGVSFKAQRWSVGVSDTDADGKCRVAVSPPDLAKKLEQDRDESGRVTDRYTITVIVTREPANAVAGWFWQSPFEPETRRWNGWQLSEDLDRYDRLYYREGGYCCLSHAPTAILEQQSLTVAVIGSARGAAVYKRIVATLRSQPK